MVIERKEQHERRRSLQSPVLHQLDKSYHGDHDPRMEGVIMARTTQAIWVRNCKRLLGTIGVIAAVSLQTGCGATPGHLVGHVFTQGGQSATTRPAAAKLTVTPTAGNAAPAVSVDTASDGSFSLDLPQGAYTVKGALTTRILAGSTSEYDVKITSGETTVLDVYSYYP